MNYKSKSSPQSIEVHKKVKSRQINVMLCRYKVCQGSITIYFRTFNSNFCSHEIRDVVLETAFLVSRPLETVFYGFGLGIVSSGLGLETLALSLSLKGSRTFSRPVRIYLSSIPPAKKARSSLFVLYTNRHISTAVIQPTPQHCTLQAYHKSASASPNTRVKTILSNAQFKCLRRFMYCVGLPATNNSHNRIFNYGGVRTGQSFVT